MLDTTEPQGEGVSGRPRRVTVLGGFLGSGKSTLLRAQLQQSTRSLPHVIVNDFAATPLDGMAYPQPVASKAMLAGGCVCCTRRNDLALALHDLLNTQLDPHRNGEVVIETSGLSDPGPIAFTLANDPVLKHHFVLAEVCVTVDAVTGLQDLDRHPVAVRQLLAADRLFVTKADLAGPESVDRLVARLQLLNPSATVTVTACGEFQRVLPPTALDVARAVAPAMTPALPHTDGVATLELQTERPLDWQAFSVWLSLLLHQHGPTVLRVKGVLDVWGAGPVALNAVQHVVHRPEHLSGQIAAGTQLVIIAQGLDMVTVQRSFNVFLGFDGKELAS